MFPIAIALFTVVITSVVENAFSQVLPQETIVPNISEKAPLGNYTAVMGTTTFSRNLRRKPASTQGIKISIKLTSLSADKEWMAIANAGVGRALRVMSKFNHGTITIAGKSYPINAVAANLSDNVLRVYILTARPFAVMGSFSNNAYGAIALEIPVKGKSKGTIYTRLFSRLSYDDELFTGDQTPTVTPLSEVQMSSPSKN